LVVDKLLFGSDLGGSFEVGLSRLRRRLASI
jgi:hypothetical protein